MITEVKVIPDEITNDYEAFLKVKAHLLKINVLMQYLQIVLIEDILKEMLTK